MDYALEQGVNFFDTAEMYSVLAREKPMVATEKSLELGLKKQEKRRSGFGFKIAGPNPTSAICGRKMIFQPLVLNALDNSLQRLQTDYIDLYQLHWPERKTNYFGKEDLKYKTTPGKITFMLF
jgi:aryl-alcohol dehydrogenase-like predicted oxidoreductase